ncbi:uncharacterized protein [Lepeophtheirus salmonis]|uniref:uncharacterized protein n=1 Tax=Lepeophtheirus salmonis TaxID=72036 RepID=UPI00077EFCB0|nr:NAD(P)H-quinone oxidoreductase subunit T, chloroplastic-like [Lepeophtheirus salmonis]XP_040569584.1 NAD(P)H-quinone oxidoreductase subunit T, chloroplastic-like [Lepeophtheirus salmonis]XP_040569585.1 NAD(P)H-quinone oxidoreductase subunit T, chloroplastic-like [Lepeophtheirus salmonis]
MQSNIRSLRFPPLNFYSSIPSWTHYKTLEITPEASSNQIKEAYYKLSKLNHPDSSVKDEDKIKKFHAVTEAYRILGTPQLRRKYDMGNLGLETSLAEVHKVTHKFESQTFYKDRSALQRKFRNNPHIDDYVSKNRNSEFRYQQANIKNIQDRTDASKNYRQDVALGRIITKTMILSICLVLIVSQVLK